MIKVIAIGKKHESWIADGLERYQKRLQRPWDIKWILLPHSTSDGVRARQEESQAILSRIDQREYVILLDEHGKLFDSPALSRLLEQQIDVSRPVTIIIGGAYGVSEDMMRRADIVWSLSPLVFPHQLVRLLLIEQLYRAQEIVGNHPYHHA